MRMYLTNIIKQERKIHEASNETLTYIKHYRGYAGAGALEET
jgi:hypothetical protein